MKKSIAASVILIAIGVFLGILLVSNFSPSAIQNLFADENTKLGADQAPVQMDNTVKLLNDAMTKASEAVLPTVVYIKVETEVKRSNNNNNQEDNDLGDLFKFFGRGMPDQQDFHARGSGSGVIISKNGYIVTNAHVVENVVDGGVTVQTFDKKEYKAKVIGKDPLTDLALIKIEADNLPVAHFGDINTVKVGEMVLAVGNPMGLNHTVTQGIVSAIGRGSLVRKGGANIEHYIQTDAAINPGNSGGGLFNLNGSLVGINTAIATETGTFMGYGFAIPIDLMKAVVNDLIDDGKIDRGYIGVYIDQVDETLAKGLGLPKIQGVLVQGLVEDGAAKNGGVKTGDVILSIDGKEVNSPSELQSKIVFYRAGDKVNLVIWRDGQKVNKTVTLKARDGEDVADKKDQVPDAGKEENSKEPIKFDKLGFSVAPLTSEIKKQYKVDNGVLVTEVKRFSIASDRGLFPNAVITDADRKEVKSTSDLKRIIESKKTGEVILLNVKYADRSQIVALEIGKS